MTGSPDERVAAWASTEWARQSACAVRHVETRLARALERQPAVRRVGESVDPGDYAGWRFEADSSLTAAGALLDMARAPDLADLVQRADAVLAEDDRVLARQATGDHAEAWEARWTRLERRAGAAGLPVHDHGDAAGAVENARRILREPDLPEPHRDRISAVVETFESRRTARLKAETWLSAWDERRPSGGSAIEDARLILADPALPEALQSRLALAIDRHERLTRVATPTATVESAPSARDDAAPSEPAAPERPVKQTTASPPPSEEDEGDRETRREEAREAANRARQKADAVHVQLENWEAHLADGRLDKVLAHADEVAQDPHLPVPGRRRLEAAATLGHRRLDAHGAHGDWQGACRSHADAAASQGRHVLDYPGHEALLAEARRLVDSTDLRESTQQAVAAFLVERADMAAARAAFLERQATWQRLEAGAEAAGRNLLDSAEAGDVVSWFRENLASTGVTDAERQAMEDVVARHEARQSERMRPDRGISWRL